MTKFYRVGNVPVKITKREDGVTLIQAFNAALGRFESNSRYYSMIRRDDTGLVRQVTEAEFDRHVKSLSQQAS
ncbi:hypothetical protein DAERI_020245 [Deinococcus aerius]|uniref:Uncharacterized protein n=2 Tax=Deinococcus TaxID=1298 RepID=A0A2I9DF48_9DEIO|nr:MULTISPECIES: hypothetical protein [Deinococcus]MBB5293891.1 hypothetical protein [Deinococcus metallilatus]QBY07163.1 hypothetical protein E5F05_04055 [Deinococcus metallilatus]RXJ14635.1 hypothetical protein ERJ73_02785 [Deinococcus metallilatus]TLK30755.1 hypothetical protein FCS05_03100 [Deinococcus metallilatus]GBF04648.1 hypothetical protein DAERI_020245 [Deinococcus aerius]